MRYGVAFYNASNDVVGPSSGYSFSHTGTEVRTEEGWRVTVNMKSNYGLMRSLYFDDHFPDDFPGFGNPICDGLGLFSLRISMTVGSEDWNPPGGVFDPNVLVEPGTMSNVTNGFGFVGAGYNQDVNLYPSEQALEFTPFFDFIGDRRPKVVGCGRYVGE
jgi:hypothetical protein